MYVSHACLLATNRDACVQEFLATPSRGSGESGRCQAGGKSFACFMTPHVLYCVYKFLCWLNGNSMRLRRWGHISTATSLIVQPADFRQMTLCSDWLRYKIGKEP